MNVSTIVSNIRKEIETIKNTPSMDTGIEPNILKVKALIRNLEALNTTDSYYSLMTLATELASVNISYEKETSVFDYAEKYFEVVDVSKLMDVSKMTKEEREQVSCAYMVLALSTKAGYKKYESMTACKLYILSFIMSPTKEMLTEAVKEYITNSEGVNYKEIKNAVDFSIKAGFYEAYVYNMLIASKEESASLENAVDEFYKALADEDKKDAILMTVNQLMYNNLKVLEAEAERTGQFNPAVVPIYCIMFITGNDLVALDLDSILMERPEYVETLKSMLSKDDLVKYVETVKELRKQKKEPN